MKVYSDLVKAIRESGNNMDYVLDQQQITRLLQAKWPVDYSSREPDAAKTVRRYVELPLATKILAMSTAQSPQGVREKDKLNMLVPAVNYSWNAVVIVRVDDLFDVVARYMSEQPT